MPESSSLRRTDKGKDAKDRPSTPTGQSADDRPSRRHHLRFSSEANRKSWAGSQSSDDVSLDERRLSLQPETQGSRYEKMQKTFHPRYLKYVRPSEPTTLSTLFSEAERSQTEDNEQLTRYYGGADLLEDYYKEGPDIPEQDRKPQISQEEANRIREARKEAYHTLPVEYKHEHGLYGSIQSPEVVKQEKLWIREKIKDRMESIIEGDDEVYEGIQKGYEERRFRNNNGHIEFPKGKTRFSEEEMNRRSQTPRFDRPYEQG